MRKDDLNQLPPNVILYGGTGQAKVVRPIVESCGSRVVAVFDDTPDLPSPFPDVEIFRGFDAIEPWLEGRDREVIGFSVTIGNPHGRVRLSLDDRLRGLGLAPVTIAHRTAWISEGVDIGEGSQILAGAVILEGAKIGRQCIVNTKASVDHECVLGDGVEIAPGATLCGEVECGVNVWIGAGATVLPRIRIGTDAVVGAGGVVTRDVPERTTLVGVPARPHDRK